MVLKSCFMSIVLFTAQKCIFNGSSTEHQFRIADMVAEKFKDTHSDSLKKMTDELEEQQVIQTALKGVGNPSATPGTSEGQQCPRTSASPEWCGDFPWNFRKRMSHTGISIADFEGGNSWLGSIW
jgi:hypothetical protein